MGVSIWRITGCEKASRSFILICNVRQVVIQSASSASRWVTETTFAGYTCRAVVDWCEKVGCLVIGIDALDESLTKSCTLQFAFLNQSLPCWLK